MPHPLAIGRHTITICEEIDAAIEAFFRGESTRLDIGVPYRHGKSDLVSRALPPYFLARCMMHKAENDGDGVDPDVIQSGYGQDLVDGFSKDAQDIIRSKPFQALFPTVKLRKGREKVTQWQIEGSAGKVHAVSLGGGLTGKGASLAIVDDHTKNRQEARSQAYRKKTWSDFKDSLFTRLSDVSILIVCATPWDVDDVQGRIKKEEEKDPEFPKFKRIRFPARNAKEEREKLGEFLFPERYSVPWYRAQYAMLGAGARSLLDCDPVAEGGNLFKVSGIVFHKDASSFPKDAKWVRAWDLASSKKERDSDDPDYTVGLLGAVTKEKKSIEGEEFEVPSLWIKDGVFCREEAPKRDEIIRATVKRDGPKVAQWVEAFGGYKDAYTSLKKALKGFAVVKKANLPGDKVVKASPLEPIFDAGNVHVIESEWARMLEAHFAAFPDGDHDDFVDPAAIIYSVFDRPGVIMVG